MGQEPTAVPAAIPAMDDLDVLQHELGNVVHGLVCVAGLLRESALDTQQRQWLAIIERACGQIHGILEHARRTRQDPAAEPSAERFNGVELLENVVLAHAPAAAAGGVDLMLRMTPSVPAYWRSDACLLRQLLDNLVGNAVRYTRNGSVIIEASTLPNDRGALVLRVLDSGPGVEDTERLFEPRRRGAAGRNGPAGSGLGLFVCRHIAGILGGEIHCANRSSGGARFEVRLPGVLQADEPDWSRLNALAGIACRLDLDPDRARCIGALLDRLGVAWRIGCGRPAEPDDVFRCVISAPARGAAAPTTGIVIRADCREPGIGPVHLPGPVLESSLESALYRLWLESRRGR